jgi:hypothetical protein
VAVGADPAKEGVGLRLMVHDRALQRRDDLLAIVDRQADVAVEQALPALVYADLLPARVAKFVPASIVTVIALSQFKTMLMDCSVFDPREVTGLMRSTPTRDITVSRMAISRSVPGVHLAADGGVFGAVAGVVGIGSWRSLRGVQPRIIRPCSAGQETTP